MNKFRSFFALIIAITALSIVNVNAQRFSGKTKPARSLEQQIFNKLVNVTDYGVFDFISFEINGGTVTLNGKINSLGTKGRAASAIKDLPGVTRVVNNIEYLPPSSFDDAIRRRMLRTFTERGPSQYFSEIRPEVRIIVENGRVTLEGYVYTSGDRNTLNILANGVNGVFHVQNNLIVGKPADR